MTPTEHAKLLRELGHFCENLLLEGAIDLAGRAYTAAAEINLEKRLRFYSRRCALLQDLQHTMRDPERQLVCDILANGTLLPDPDRTRYPYFG